MTADAINTATSAPATPAALGEHVLIIGAGNTVMADEGVGPTALAYLQEHFDFPAEVELLDVGTTGLAMLSYLQGFDHLIVLDAAQDTGHPPGTVLFFTPDELASQQVMHSAHDQRLTDVLRAAALTGIDLKSVVVIGVQIESLAEFVLSLSEPVEQAVPIACAAALYRLKELGYQASPKPEAKINPKLLEALKTYAPETTPQP
jgi:hydrogenase maturation protease